MGLRKWIIRPAGGFRSHCSAVLLSFRGNACGFYQVSTFVSNFRQAHVWRHADTQRWYYARSRWEEEDIVLARFNGTAVEHEKVQPTRREILAAIEAELEANSSLHWKQFLTMDIVDKTRMKIVRWLCVCFWLHMVREWMGSSLIAYYSERVSFILS